MSRSTHITYILGLLSLIGMSSVSLAQTKTESRHVVMLHPGFDTVWGTYMFGVRNEGSAPEKFRSSLALPKETVDFQAQEGLAQEDLTSGGEDGLIFEKEFPPGLTLISIGFKVNSEFGEAQLTFHQKSDVGQFSVVTKQGSLLISSASALMDPAMDAVVSEESFTSITSKGPITAGESVVINVSRVPEGRTRLWYSGAIIAALLVVIAVGMTLKTMGSSRPGDKVEVV